MCSVKGGGGLVCGLSVVGRRVTTYHSTRSHSREENLNLNRLHSLRCKSISFCIRYTACKFFAQKMNTGRKDSTACVVSVLNEAVE